MKKEETTDKEKISPVSVNNPKFPGTSAHPERIVKSALDSTLQKAREITEKYSEQQEDYLSKPET